MAALTESVSIENHGAVAVITVNNPPVNALSHHVCTGIVDGIEEKRGRERCDQKGPYNKLMTELVRHLASTLPSIAIKTADCTKRKALKHALQACEGTHGPF